MDSNLSPARPRTNLGTTPKRNFNVTNTDAPGPEFGSEANARASDPVAGRAQPGACLVMPAASTPNRLWIVSSSGRAALGNLDWWSMRGSALTRPQTDPERIHACTGSIKALCDADGPREADSGRSGPCEPPAFLGWRASARPLASGSLIVRRWPGWVAEWLRQHGAALWAHCARLALRARRRWRAARLAACGADPR